MSCRPLGLGMGRLLGAGILHPPLGTDVGQTANLGGEDPTDPSTHHTHTHSHIYLCIPTHSHTCVHVSTHTLTPTHMHTHALGLILTALGQSWGGMSCVAPVLPLMAPLLSSNAGLTLTQDLPQATDWHQSPGSAHQPKDIATSVFPLFTGLRPHAKGQGKWADWGSHLSRRWGCSPPGE